MIGEGVLPLLPHTPIQATKITNPTTNKKNGPGPRGERGPKKKTQAGSQPRTQHPTMIPGDPIPPSGRRVAFSCAGLAGGWFVGLPRTGYPLSRVLCPPSAPSAQEPRCATILHRAPPRFAAHHHGPPCPTVRHRAPRCSTALHRTPPCPYVIFLRNLPHLTI